MSTLQSTSPQGRLEAMPPAGAAPLQGLILCVLAFSLAVQWWGFTGERSYGQPRIVPGGSPPGMDHLHVIVASRALLAGLSVYENHAARGERFRDPPAGNGVLYVYPPLAAYLFVPLAPMPNRWSYAAWTCLQIGMLALLLYHLRVWLPQDTWLRACYGVLALGSYPVLFALERGNFDSLVLAFLAVGLWFWVHRRYPYLTAVCIGAAAALKLYPLIFVAYFALKRDWRAAFGSAAAFFLLLACAGAHMLPDYGAVLARLVAEVQDNLWIGNHATAAFFLRLGTLFTLPDEPVIRVLLGVARGFNVLLLGLSAALVWRWNHRDPLRRLLELVLFVLVMTVVPNVAYDYNLLFAILIPVPLAVALTRLRPCLATRVLSGVTVLALAHLWCATWPLANRQGTWVTVVLGSKFPAIIGLWCAVIGIVLRLRVETHEPADCH